MTPVPDESLPPPVADQPLEPAPPTSTDAPAVVPATPARVSSLPVVLVLVAGWLVPGMAHLLLRRYVRAAALCMIVGGFMSLGVVLRGHLFGLHPDDAFEWLGLVSNLGAGAFYWVARVLETGGPDVSRAAGDFGTRFFSAAGVLNLLCVLDAYDILQGRKP